MKEPRRIRDDNASSAELSLLRSARLDMPPSGSKRRLLATLGVATAGSAAAAATPGATMASIVSKWLAAGMLAGTVATGSIEVARSHLDSHRVRSEASRVAPSLARGGISVTRAANAASAASVEASGAAPPGAPSTVESTPQRARLGAPSQAAPSQAIQLRSAPPEPVPPQLSPSQPMPMPALAEEISALDRARQALQGRDPTAASRMLDAFEASFPNARLRPEARVLRMEVLLGVGRYDEARAVGRRLLESDPSSALTQRVRSLLRNAEAREIQNSPFGH